MRRREEKIADFVFWLSDKCGNFTRPKLVVIGGYALRAYVPFSRYSRDCDFVLKDGLDVVRAWKPSDVVEASFEREEGHAFMRWSRTFVLGRQKVQLGLDFMEGQVRGRAGEAFTIDDRFLADSRLETLKVGVQECRLLVPSYADFFVLKAASARRGDVRDIASAGVEERCA